MCWSAVLRPSVAIIWEGDSCVNSNYPTISSGSMYRVQWRIAFRLKVLKYLVAGDEMRDGVMAQCKRID